MSGDVQPRKRKDKKRRRDDEDNRPSGVHSTKMGPDDIQLHVHSDHETGGHWCAKLFFFSLLAILLGLIGLILLENRGLSDLDTPLSESRFADMLEGWVDEERELHDEHDAHAPPDSHEHDDHDEHDGDDDNLANSQEHEDDEHDDHDDDETELTKDDPNNDDEKDEGFDESGETEDTADADNDDDDDNEDNDDDRTKNSKLTVDAVNHDIPTNSHATNTIAQNIQKRSIDASMEDIAQVTVSKLKKQVDDLVDNYNKLAKTLNRPLIHETNTKDQSHATQRADENDNEDDEENQLQSEDNDDDDNDDDDDDDNKENKVDDNDDDEDEGIADDDNDNDNELDNDQDTDDTPDEPADVDDDDDGDDDDSPALDDDGNEIEPEADADTDDDQPAQDDEQEEEEQGGSHADDQNDEAKPTSDTETFDEASAEFLDMKRRFTLVTAEEPLSSSDEETKEHQIIIETILPIIDETVKTIESPKLETIVPNEIQTANVSHSDEEEIGASDEIELKGDHEQTAIDEELLSEEEEEEEISSEGQDYDSESSVDDSDLLKRLDEKYGRLPVTKDDDDHDYDIEDEDIDPTWTKIDRSGPAAIQTEDQLLEDEIRRANEQLAEDPQSALTQFERIRKTHPTSIAAQYGVAKALDELADLKRSNALLKRAIEEYEKYISLGAKLNDTEFKIAAERCINRMRFIGEHIKAVSIHEKLIERFDDNPYYRNQLAVTYLLVNRLVDAKYVLHMTLQRWRDDGFAAVHYGFVLKNLDNNLEHAVIFLRQGIDSGENGTDDGRFYFNLGDALIRLGRHNEAKDVFKEAAKKKLFPSEYQRSLYNVEHLKAQPFWTLAETGYKHEFQIFEQNWQKIRDEGLSILNKDGFFTDEAENLRDTGIWKQFELFARGKRNSENCQKTPFTCKLIETFPAARFCKRGQVKFSVMHPNTHVWPHCGPTNCRLRAHLGLKTVDNTSIRVATETRIWIEGKIMVFDDSFEHEVWHNGTTYRLILILDVWHPDLTADEKKTLVPI